MATIRASTGFPSAKQFRLVCRRLGIKARPAKSWNLRLVYRLLCVLRTIHVTLGSVGLYHAVGSRAVESLTLWERFQIALPRRNRAVLCVWQLKDQPFLSNSFLPDLLVALSKWVQRNGHSYPNQPIPVIVESLGWFRNSDPRSVQTTLAICIAKEDGRYLTFALPGTVEFDPKRIALIIESAKESARPPKQVGVLVYLQPQQVFTFWSAFTALPHGWLAIAPGPLGECLLSMDHLVLDGQAAIGLAEALIHHWSAVRTPPSTRSNETSCGDPATVGVAHSGRAVCRSEAIIACPMAQLIPTMIVPAFARIAMGDLGMHEGDALLIAATPVSPSGAVTQEDIRKAKRILPIWIALGKLGRTARSGHANLLNALRRGKTDYGTTTMGTMFRLAYDEYIPLWCQRLINRFGPSVPAIGWIYNAFHSPLLWSHIEYWTGDLSVLKKAQFMASTIKAPGDGLNLMVVDFVDGDPVNRKRRETVRFTSLSGRGRFATETSLREVWARLAAEI